MNIQIQEANLASAALLTQLLLLFIMFTGALILWIFEQRIPYYRKTHGTDARVFAWVILPLGIITIGALVLSRGFAQTWSPVFVGLHPPLMDTTTSIALMVVADVVGISTLAYNTGGSRNSPFTPLLFIVPALALFLRQSFYQVTVYTALLFFLFSILLYLHRVPQFHKTADEDMQREIRRADSFTYWWITLATLSLTTIVAFIADPRWVPQPPN